VAASSKAMPCFVMLAAALRASHSKVTLAVYLMASSIPDSRRRDPRSLYIGDRKNLSFAFHNDEEMIEAGHACNGYHPPMYRKERGLYWGHEVTDSSSVGPSAPSKKYHRGYGNTPH
jgi:hypothetical protein